MPLDNLPLVWTQLIVGLVGWLISLYTCQDTWITFRVLRALKQNSIRETITTGDLLDELSRVAAHVMIVGSTILFVVRGEQPALWYNRAAFLCVTVLLALSSVNSFVCRRKVMKLMEDLE